MCLDCFCFRGSDSEGWKEFISKPSLPYVLRMLTGLCSGHDSTQVFFLLLYLLYHYPFGCKIYFPIFIGIGYKNFSLLVPYSCAFSPQSWNNLLCKPFFFLHATLLTTFPLLAQFFCFSGLFAPSLEEFIKSRFRSL